MKHGVESMVFFLYQNVGDFTGNESMSMSMRIRLWVTLVPFQMFQDEHIKTKYPLVNKHSY
jgi:hypothetical protein